MITTTEMKAKGHIISDRASQRADEFQQSPRSLRERLSDAKAEELPCRLYRLGGTLHVDKDGA